MSDFYFLKIFMITETYKFLFHLIFFVRKKNSKIIARSHEREHLTILKIKLVYQQRITYGQNSLT